MHLQSWLSRLRTDAFGTACRRLPWLDDVSALGMTIFEYIERRRMEAARRMLRTDGLSVTEIALEVGYEYSCNLSVAYKRHFGFSPWEERASLRH